MTKTLSLTILLLLLPLSLGACGNDYSDNGGNEGSNNTNNSSNNRPSNNGRVGDTSPIPINQLCNKYVETRNCELPSEITEENLREFCELALVRPVQRGVVTYDPAAAGRCLGSIINCEPTDEASCENTFLGTLGDGEACYSGLECDQGSCRTRDTCPGACQADAGPGESCTERNCDNDTYCNDSDICATSPVLGEPCPNYECTGNLVCDISLNGDTLICIEAPPPRQEGESCNGNYEYCVRGLYCAEDRTCTPLVALGDTCSTDFGGIYSCQDGGVCIFEPDAETGTCGSTQPGQPCPNSGTQKRCSNNQFCDDELEVPICQSYNDEGPGDLTQDCVRP